MTEYELHALITELYGLTFSNFETWVGVTAGLLFAGYYGRDKIGPILRRIVIGIYIASGVLIVSNLVQITYAIEKYREQLSFLAATEYPFHLISSLTSGVAILSIFVIGTTGAIYYFARSTTQKSGAAH